MPISSGGDSAAAALVAGATVASGTAAPGPAVRDRDPSAERGVDKGLAEISLDGTSLTTSVQVLRTKLRCSDRNGRIVEQALELWRRGYAPHEEPGEPGPQYR